MSNPNPTAHLPRTILVTGGAGFIGANLVHYFLTHDTTLRLVVLDALTYAGVRENLQDCEGPRCRFVQGDIGDRTLVDRLLREHDIDTVIHLAAESHVDRSIDGPAAFIHTNILGTFTLLEACRAYWGKRQDVRFHHVSTDEVFGSLGAEGLFSEDTPYDPSSPYSASKAASDHLVRAWSRTFALPITLSNCSNNYGPRQFPEKLLPLMIAKALAGEELPVYGDGKQIRDWLFVADHCSAIDRIVRHGQLGRTYNVGGNNQLENMNVVQQLCSTLEHLRPSGRPGGYHRQIRLVTDRPGHDRRYAINCQRIANELGWQPATSFAAGLSSTVAWYLANTAWLETIRARGYQQQRLGLR